MYFDDFTIYKPQAYRVCFELPCWITRLDWLEYSFVIENVHWYPIIDVQGGAPVRGCWVDL